VPNRIFPSTLLRSAFRAPSCWVALLLAGAAGPASADSLFYVLTDSQSAAGNPSNNNSGDIENVYNSTAGATQSLENFGFAYTVSGSPNVLGLTSSFDQTSANAGGPGDNFSSSFAAADLAAGIVRADANSPTGDAEAGANAEVYDTLTFNIPGATSSTTTLLAVGLTLDGSFNGNGTVETKLLFGSADAETEWGLNFPPAFSRLLGWASDSYSISTSDYTFQGTIAVQGANPVVQIYFQLLLSCDSFSVCSEQYQDTGALSLSLPSNVTYTSASGVFLTSSAPEPSTLVPAGLSLAGLLWGVARRRKTLSSPHSGSMIDMRRQPRIFLPRMFQGTGPVSMYNVAKSTEPERADAWMSRLTAQATSHSCCGDGAPGIPPSQEICSN
jgi:hypothetical protein